MQLTIRSKIQRCKIVEIRLESIVRRGEIKARNKRRYRNNLHKQGSQWEIQKVSILLLSPTIYSSTP
jgi:hypothetical protein